jgi:hypothetical protein
MDAGPLRRNVCGATLYRSPSHPMHAKPEYQISLAVVGVLLAIGVPALKRGDTLLGGALCAAGALLLGWFAYVLLRR